MLITSPDNPVLKKIRKALALGGLTDDGLAVAEGPHLVEEAIRSGLRIERILESEEAADFGFDGVDFVSPRIFREIKGTEHSQGILALVQAPVWKLEETVSEEPAALVVVLDAIQDPGNAGTIIRSAEAFGATGVVLLKGCVHPWNPKCLRASTGSLFRLPVVYGVSALEPLESLNWYAAAGESESTINVVDFTPGSVLFVGNEGAGLSPAWMSLCQTVRIPTAGVESLNAAVAASVILYEASRQRSAAILRIR